MSYAEAMAARASSLAAEGIKSCSLAFDSGYSNFSGSTYYDVSGTRYTKVTGYSDGASCNSGWVAGTNATCSGSAWPDKAITVSAVSQTVSASSGYGTNTSCTIPSFVTPLPEALYRL